VHGFTSYVRRGEDLSPVIDDARGVNTYASFAGSGQSHDANGNGTRDGKHAYLYDAGNRLVSVESSSGAPIARYTYDADHRRVLRETASGITRYLYCGWTLVEEREVSGSSETLARQYVTREGLDRPVQMVAYSGSSPGTYYYHLDPGGNVGALSDASGEVVYHVEYDALGGGVGGRHLVDPKDPSRFLGRDPTGNPYFWQSRDLDPESGLYYFRHRYYDPEQGRFLHADPLGTWGDAVNVGNRYAFGGQRTGTADPLGLSSEPGSGFFGKAFRFGKGLATGALVGAAVGAISVAVPPVGVGIAAYFVITEVDSRFAGLRSVGGSFRWRRS